MSHKHLYSKILSLGLFLFSFGCCLCPLYGDSAYIIPLRDFRESTNGAGLVRVAKIIKGHGPKKPTPNMSSGENFNRFSELVGLSPTYYLNPLLWWPSNWKDLGNDVEGEEVQISYRDGQGNTVSRSVITDDEGHVWLDPRWMAHSKVTISFPKYSKYKATPKKTSSFSLANFTGDTLFFTDHDDTQKYTGVAKTSKKRDKDGDKKRSKSFKSLLRIMKTNPYDWHAFPGAPELANAITGGGKKVPMVVITGSPVFMAEDIETFYKIKGFPRPSAIHLRNLKDGTDSHPDPSDALKYKNQVFTKALDGAVKNGRLKTVIFDGDRGEKDPEVALAMAKKYPNLHFIVGIQNITSDDPNSKRYNEIKKLKNVDFISYDNKYEFASLLYQKGKISKASLEKVKRGIEKANRKIARDVKAGKIRKKPRWYSLFPSRHLTLKDLKKAHLYLPSFRPKTSGAVRTLRGLGH